MKRSERVLIYVITHHTCTWSQSSARAPQSKPDRRYNKNKQAGNLLVEFVSNVPFSDEEKMCGFRKDSRAGLVDRADTRCARLSHFRDRTHHLNMQSGKFVLFFFPLYYLFSSQTVE